MRQRVGTSFVRAVLAATLAVQLLACDDGGGPPARGYGSRQVMALRDPNFAFVGYGKNTAFFTTGGGPASGTLPTYYVVDHVTGEVRNLGPTLDTTAPPPGTRFTCTWQYDTDDVKLRILDTQSGIETVVDHAYSANARCPTEEDPSLELWRYDDARNITLWAGRYDALEERPIALVMRQIIDGKDRQAVVIAALPETPAAFGLYAVDLDSRAISEVIAPVAASPAWAPGAVAQGPLASDSLTAVSSGVSAFQDHYLYLRTMNDGSTVLFAGPFPSAPNRELALFPIASITFGGRISVSRYYPVTSNDPAWLYPSAAGGAYTLYYWQSAARQLVTCELPSQRVGGFASPDGRSVALAVDNDFSSSPSQSGPLVLLRLDPAGGGACTTLATSDVTVTGFSPDSARMYWLSAPDAGNSTLWVADADGGAARALGTGEITASPTRPYFLSGNELLLRLGKDLAWVDVRDDPVRMHYIVERVSGQVRSLGDWLLVIGQYSAQDETGRLMLVDRRSGAKRLISTEVQTYLSLTNAEPLEPGVTVTYLVRGRNPSAQDGVWMASIPTGAFQ